MTTEELAKRLEEALDTAERLPPARVRGYFNLWPPTLRTRWEKLAAEDQPWCHLPPLPDAVDRMVETFGWVALMADEQRYLLWLRAERISWEEIGKQIGCDRRTAKLRWHRALIELQAMIEMKSALDSYKKQKFTDWNNRYQC